MTKQDRRRRLLEILKREEPIWRDEDHPELRSGAAEWVRKVRAESEARFERLRQRLEKD
jgi:hypothetical protein